MKTILVPSDYTEIAECAIRSAAMLAKRIDAVLIIFHVITDKEEEEQDYEVVLEKLFSDPLIKGVQYHFKKSTGDLIDTIVAQQADLIVMGSRGASGLEGFIVGTISEKVTKQAECPVITVKKTINLGQIRKIVFPTDMSPEQSEIIDKIKELQSLNKAHLHIAKVYDDAFTLERDVKKRLSDFAKFHQLQDYSITAIPGIDQAALIMDFANNLKADLIMMATHDHHGLSKLLSGNISSEITNEGDQAVWTYSIP